jgi:hypothetical protein
MTVQIRLGEPGGRPVRPTGTFAYADGSGNAFTFAAVAAALWPCAADPAWRARTGRAAGLAKAGLG